MASQCVLGEVREKLFHLKCKFADEKKGDSTLLGYNGLQPLAAKQLQIPQIEICTTVTV